MSHFRWAPVSVLESAAEAELSTKPRVWAVSDPHPTMDHNSEDCKYFRRQQYLKADYIELNEAVDKADGESVMGLLEDVNKVTTKFHKNDRRALIQDAHIVTKISAKKTKYITKLALDIGLENDRQITNN